MKFIKVQRKLQVVLILVVLVLMWGCGGVGRSAPNVVVSKGPALSVIPSSNGAYVIQGDSMDGVAGIELTINYDSSTLVSPTVIEGGLISGALLVANTEIPGTIKVAIISNTAFSGNGQVATVSFATVTGTGSVSIVSAKMIDTKGKTIQ